jgi:hypothetical protein
MGGSWSQQAPDVTQESVGEGSREEPARRKRRWADENDNSSVEAEPRRKRRRVVKAWDSFSEFLTSLMAKGFLVAAEWATYSANQGELAEEKDLIQALLQMLDYFQSSNVDILRRGWRVLCACSSTASPVGTEPALDSDIATVVTAMKLHSKSIKIQLLGCRALRTLVINSGETWEGLCHAGAVKVFLEALRNFPDDLVMQGLAITFVAMVVREEGEFPRRQALANGAIQLILDAMRRFEDDPRLLHTGCYALHQLGFIRQSRSMILSNGGIDVLLQSVKRHMDDAALTDLCLSALSKLSDEENLTGHGAIPLILESMERWPDEQSIQGHNLVLILRVVGQEPIPKRRCIKLILSAMRNFPRSASLQFFACATLREILQRTQGREALDIASAEGGIECVLTAVKNHRGIFGLQPMALLFLLHIFEQRQPEQEEAISAFAGSEDVVALVAALRVEIDPELHIPVVEIRR